MLTLPISARLTGFAAIVDGLDLLEFDLGDSSDEALELGWMQVSEQAREQNDYRESRLDDLAWVAEFNTAEEGESLLALHRNGSWGLLLRASLAVVPDARQRADRLRGRYRSDGQKTSRTAGFALRHGFIEALADRPEECEASFLLPDSGAVVSISTCIMAVTAEANFAALRDAMVAGGMGTEVHPATAVAELRDIGGLRGEELRLSITEGSHLRRQATWRYSGVAKDLLRPEIEVEYLSGPIETDQAELEWLSIISTLRLLGVGP